jgi:hypothetical protein
MTRIIRSAYRCKRPQWQTDAVTVVSDRLAFKPRLAPMA